MPDHTGMQHGGQTWHTSIDSESTTKCLNVRLLGQSRFQLQPQRRQLADSHAMANMQMEPWAVLLVIGDLRSFFSPGTGAPKMSDQNCLLPCPYCVETFCLQPLRDCSPLPRPVLPLRFLWWLTSGCCSLLPLKGKGPPGQQATFINWC